MNDPADAAGGGRTVVRIHAIFHSGTNLAKYMLGQQFDCTTTFHGGGHKHLSLPCLPGNTENTRAPTVLHLMSPLASVVSLFRRARALKFRNFDCSPSWHEFLRRRLVSRMNGNLLWPDCRFADPIDNWNAFYLNAFSIPHQHLFVLNYESLRRDLSAVMNALAARSTALTRAGAPCELPAHKLSRGADHHPHAVLADQAFDDACWYLGRRHLGEFDAAEFAVASAQVDREVLTAASCEASDIPVAG